MKQNTNRSAHSALVEIFSALVEQNTHTLRNDHKKILSLMVRKLQAFKAYYSHWSKMRSHRPILANDGKIFNSIVSYPLITLSPMKIARLVAHHWKKLNFSMGILTFLIIPYEFWHCTYRRHANRPRSVICMTFCLSIITQNKIQSGVCKIEKDEKYWNSFSMRMIENIKFVLVLADVKSAKALHKE